jgi:UV DNA damage repair endonuclease
LFNDKAPILEQENKTKEREQARYEYIKLKKSINKPITALINIIKADIKDLKNALTYNQEDDIKLLI